MITNGEIIWVNVVAVCGTLNNYSQNAMLSESRKRTLVIRRNIQKFCESARTRVRSFDVENWRQELLELFFFIISIFKYGSANCCLILNDVWLVSWSVFEVYIKKKIHPSRERSGCLSPVRWLIFVCFQSCFFQFKIFLPNSMILPFTNYCYIWEWSLW